MDGWSRLAVDYRRSCYLPLNSNGNSNSIDASRLALLPASTPPGLYLIRADAGSRRSELYWQFYAMTLSSALSVAIHWLIVKV